MKASSTEEKPLIRAEKALPNPQMSVFREAIKSTAVPAIHSGNGELSACCCGAVLAKPLPYLALSEQETTNCRVSLETAMLTPPYSQGTSSSSGSRAHLYGDAPHFPTSCAEKQVSSLGQPGSGEPGGQRAKPTCLCKSTFTGVTWSAAGSELCCAGSCSRLS